MSKTYTTLSTGLTTTDKTVVGAINEVKNVADSKSKIETYTKAEFEGLAQKDADTYYIITDDMETGILPTKLSQLENDSGYVTTVDLSAYQQTTDNSLKTTSKEIVGAINEVNDKIGEMKIYTSLAQLSLTSGITITTIFNAMPNNSILKLEVASNTEVTDIPTNSSGILMIDKGNSSSGFDIQYKLSSNSGTATNSLYIGQLQGSDGSGLTWRRLCSTSIEDSEKTVMLSLPSNFTGISNGAYVKCKVVNGWCIVSFTVGVTKITASTSSSDYKQCATGLPPSAGTYYYGLFSENGNTATQVTVMFKTDGTLRILAQGSEVSAKDFYLGNFAYPVKES